MSRSAIAAAVLLALVNASAAGARVPVLPQPTGSFAGTLTATWTEILRADTTTRTDAVITYTVEDRLRSAGEAEAWVPQPQPDFVLAEFRGDYAHLLRATVSVDAFTRTVDDVCDDGQAARTTTVVTGLVQPHALLQTTQDPTLNLPRRTGVTDLRPVDVIAGSVASEQEIVAATGIVATRTTGTDCGDTDQDGLSEPRAVDTQAELHLGALAGADVIEAMVDAADLSLRVAPDGTLVMDRPQSLLYQGLKPDTDTLTGSLTPDVRLAGPPRAQRALCALPTRGQVSRVHSLRAARRLLRRHGFPDVVFVAPRGRPPRSFTLHAPSPYDFCGVTLGTRRHPVLKARS